MMATSEDDPTFQITEAMREEEAALALATAKKLEQKASVSTVLLGMFLTSAFVVRNNYFPLQPAGK
jgi:hypothetical protein